METRTIAVGNVVTKVAHRFTLADAYPSLSGCANLVDSCKFCDTIPETELPAKINANFQIDFVKNVVEKFESYVKPLIAFSLLNIFTRKKSVAHNVTRKEKPPSVESIEVSKKPESDRKSASERIDNGNIEFSEILHLVRRENSDDEDVFG